MTKKLLILFFLFYFSSLMVAQVKFCVPGTKWTAIYTSCMWCSPAELNTAIVYAGDTIIGADTIKILQHEKFYNACNYFGAIRTLIKQNGDTIWLSNAKTSNTWQVLFNFEALPGQGWSTKYVIPNKAVVTNSYVVISVGSTTINSAVVKKLQVSVTYSYNFSTHTYTTEIVERYGYPFLLAFNSFSGGCDGDYLISPLCYSDNEIGTISFSSLPCHFENPSAVFDQSDDNKLITIFPNPFEESLFLKAKDGIEAENLNIFNSTGRKQPIEIKVKDGMIFLNTSTLNNGLYFLQLFKDGKIIQTAKLIKN